MYKLVKTFFYGYLLSSGLVAQAPNQNQLEQGQELLGDNFETCANYAQTKMVDCEL